MFYDAIPDTLFKSEKERPFSIYDVKIRPEDAICLFEIELSQWNIKKVEVNDDFCVTKLKLEYEYDSKNEEKKTDSRSIPDSILKLENLTHLDLSNVKLSNRDKAIFETLQCLTNLKQVDLRNNNLQDIPAPLSNLVNSNCEILI